jgi:uncharacterized protein YgfB (UPF0149 family)
MDSFHEQVEAKSVSIHVGVDSQENHGKLSNRICIKREVAINYQIIAGYSCALENSINKTSSQSVAKNFLHFYMSLELLKNAMKLNSRTTNDAVIEKKEAGMYRRGKFKNVAKKIAAHNSTVKQAMKKLKDLENVTYDEPKKDKESPVAAPMSEIERYLREKVIAMLT